MSTEKKRQAITLETKKQIIHAKEKEKKTTAELAAEFGVSERTIRDILSKKEAILNAIDGGSDPKRARLQKPKFEDIDDSLHSWTKFARSQNADITEAILKV
ncbi:homeodomain-like domain-containing protein [Ditylenchus destructor]|nr:homeodomain-like domain-containing protein [Ditylenchus destructor]